MSENNCEPIQLDQVQTIFYLTIAPIACCTCAVNITTILAFQKRRLSSEVQLIASFYQWLITLNFFITGIFYQTHNVQTDDCYQGLCRVQSFLQVWGLTGNFIYSLTFSLLISLQLNATLKAQKDPKVALFHLIANLIVIAVPIAVDITKQYGANSINVCGIMISWPEFYSNVGAFSIFFISTQYSLYNLRKNLNLSEPLMNKNQFVTYYLKYSFAFQFIWFINILCDLTYLLRINNGKAPILATQLIEASAMCSFPIILFVIRYFDTKIHKQLIRVIAMVTCSVKEEDEHEKIGELESFKDKENQMKGCPIEDNPESFLDHLVCRIKLGLIVSILSGVCLIQKDYNNHIQSEELNVQGNGEGGQESQKSESLDGLSLLALSTQKSKSESVDNFRQRMSTFQRNRFKNSLYDADSLLKDVYFIDLNMLKEQYDYCLSLQILQTQIDQDFKSYEFVQCKVISYCPTIFKIIKKDEESVNLEEAFNVIKNKGQIKSFSSPTGGKSGEFFFFSSDNKLIIKTLSAQELATILQRMNGYLLHFLNNPDSLIAKILGLYTFSRCQRKEFYHILVMKNVASLPRQYIIRTYDLKGSTYDRQVLQQNSKVKNLSKVTLKDLDFHLIEETVKVEPDEAMRIQQILMRDADFFKNMKLIDYSLLLQKINLLKYANDQKTTVENIIKISFPSSEVVIKSNFEIGIYYTFGIIDYLQEWNVEKNLERNAKKFLNANSKLDTSAQDPIVYAERFKKNLAQKIF